MSDPVVAASSSCVTASSVTERQLADLQEILGDKGLLQGTADLATYETCVRYGAGTAAFVARPQNSAELSRVLAYCVTQGICLIPQSGNSGLVGASTPDGTGTQGVLSLDRLTLRDQNGKIELDEDNRSVTVGAGVRLSDLNSFLAERGYSFPIDLGADPRIGGMIATNTGGARFLRYGDVRQNTLGIKVVLADAQGTELDFMSGLRKDNTGVDWKQIFIGTSGVYGVITEAVLNVERLPKQSAAALLVPRDEEAVLPLLRALEERCGSQLTAFEGMSAEAMACAFDHVPSLRNPFPGGELPGYAILAEVSRSWDKRDAEESLDDLLEAVLAEIWEFDGEPLANAFIGRPEEMWSLRHALSEGVKHAGKLVPFDVSFRRGVLMEFRAAMAQDLPKHFPEVRICDFGHIGDGGLHFNLAIAKDDPRLADESFIPSLRNWVVTRVVEDFNGSFSAEHAIGRSNQGFYDAYTPEKIKNLAAGLKDLTSPGKLGAVKLG
ncbi:FAD-binding oxidoreductase [Kiloniella laminariae]|uniref:FAD-binding oxidoreductase n=1 Tax=Kiloniella laminariae TaxID=454162 RepID=A0ABT4LFS4_9PROT|nr:FAD-binding oxidoreductase [Kiloniella laminariae]MCZ4279950.1 FAD-binding oxidoreductase [Kiloniella laminariae]